MASGHSLVMLSRAQGSAVATGQGVGEAHMLTWSEYNALYAILVTDCLALHCSSISGQAWAEHVLSSLLKPLSVGADRLESAQKWKPSPCMFIERSLS